MKRWSDFGVIAGLLLGLVGALVVLAIGLAAAGYTPEQVATIVGLIGGITVTPILVAAIPLMSKMRELPATTQAAAADARAAKENTEELKSELNGKMDARIRKIVRDEMPGLVDDSVRRVLIEMNLSCPREEVKP